MELNENENLKTNINNSSEEKSVFVSGIPYTTTETELREIFEKCGIINSIKLPKYQDSGRNLGYAHIVFQKQKGVEKVKKLFLYKY